MADQRTWLDLDSQVGVVTTFLVTTPLTTGPLFPYWMSPLACWSKGMATSSNSVPEDTEQVLAVCAEETEDPSPVRKGPTSAHSARLLWSWGSSTDAGGEALVATRTGGWRPTG